MMAPDSAPVTLCSNYNVYRIKYMAQFKKNLMPDMCQMSGCEHTITGIAEARHDKCFII